MIIKRCDCIDYMRDCDDGQFDLAVVDPPYFDGPNKSGYYGKGYSNLGVSRASHYDDFESDCWDIPSSEYFEELGRISKNQIIWGANHFAGRFNSASPCWIVWDKDNGKSSFSDVELAYTSFNGGARIFKYVWNGMHQGTYGGNVKLNEKRINPTQKPVALYRWILDKFAKPGQKILDTHLGSGSIAIAAHYFGCEFVGLEKSQVQFDKTMERIKNETKQVKLF